MCFFCWKMQNFENRSTIAKAITNQIKCLEFLGHCVVTNFTICSIKRCHNWCHDCHRNQNGRLLVWFYVQYKKINAVINKLQHLLHMKPELQ